MATMGVAAARVTVEVAGQKGAAAVSRAGVTVDQKAAKRVVATSALVTEASVAVEVASQAVRLGAAEIRATAASVAVAAQAVGMAATVDAWADPLHAPVGSCAARGSLASGRRVAPPLPRRPSLQLIANMAAMAAAEALTHEGLGLQA